MSHQTQARSRNAHHAIADKQNKPPQTSNMRQSRTQPTNKQPKRAHRDERSKTPYPKQDAQPHAMHKTRRTAPRRTTPHANTRKPRDRAHIKHSHGASRHRIRNQRHHARQPHPRRGAFPSRAQCANHGPATGEREPPERAHTGSAHPDDAESRPDVAGTRKSQESRKRRLEAPKEVKTPPTQHVRDSSGQQRNRTSPEQFERTD